MTEIYAYAMMAGGTFGVMLVAAIVCRPIGEGARLRMDAASRE